MNRLHNLFQQKNARILSVYFTAGFPQLNDTREILRQLQAHHVDMVEIGIPFSDPMADGVVIQESSHAALQQGMSLKKLFEQLEGVRLEIDMPLIMMGYLNPIMQFGFESFCHKCHAVGIDGVIIPDLPFNEYLRDYKLVADTYNLSIIMLITPQTDEERIRLIDSQTDSFIYMVSSAATTGAQKSFNEEKQAYFRRIKAMQLKNPQLIGFGISNAETLHVAFENARGAIVGSQFIKELQLSPHNIALAVEQLIKRLSPQ
ncbi:tryptophan synthase subunit alpha [Microbacter margulisiae]|uniref:Tryptophan synthase alpha chain n=2 Tax=Microbacter margulisiae TaxID=1350067 RepID=A0A7W5H102_9PORP|nr:tryptophan synthase subunit alpha [Microbacter margulisiae]MBB3185841.1 tryptophan synthase alpha chain [Microbacter margulisiae]